MSWLYILVFGLAIIGWLALLGGIGLAMWAWWRPQRDEAAPDPPPPLPQRTHPWAVVSYGTRRARAHRRCLANRQDACAVCAPVIGRPVTPRQP